MVEGTSVERGQNGSSYILAARDRPVLSMQQELYHSHIMSGWDYSGFPGPLCGGHRRGTRFFPGRIGLDLRVGVGALEQLLDRKQSCFSSCKELGSWPGVTDAMCSRVALCQVPKPHGFFFFPDNSSEKFLTQSHSALGPEGCSHLA